MSNEIAGACGCGGNNPQEVTVNFGASAWAYTPPTGATGITA